MKSKLAMTITICLCIISLNLQGCGNEEGSKQAEKLQTVDVKVELVRYRKLTDAVEVSGTVKADEDANISPEEGGVVKRWVVKKGEPVKKGDLILELNDEIIKAGFSAAEAQYNMAELNLEKQKEVYEQKGISELQFKNLQYARDAAKANSDLMRSRWERTKIRSPFDGRVEDIFPKEGEFAPPGMPIARVVNLSSIKIEAELPELYAGSIPMGAEASVEFDAISGLTLKGRVNFIGSTLSPSNRTLKVEIALATIDKKIKPEMMAKVRISRETKAKSLLVSNDIIQLVDKDRNIVYVEENGKAVERKLSLGAHQGNLVEVLAGLREGDRLIVSGYQKCANGTTVAVTE